MTKRTKIIIAVIVSCVFTGMAVLAFMGRYASRAILDSFETVNDGLESIHQTLDARTNDTRDRLTKIGCTQLAAQAKDLLDARQELNARIDSFKAGLALVNLDDTDAADSLFDANGRGERLHKNFLAYFDGCERLCANDSIDERIRRSTLIEGERPELAEWRTHFFFHVPAIACTTILSKIRSDATNAEWSVLQDMLARCDQAQRD